mgnify:CR=1 FL=1
MNALLEITGLRGGYGQVEVLRGVDLHVNTGEMVALLGSNGVATTFASPHPTFPDVSRIYTEAEPVTSNLAPFRTDSVGFGLVTRFDT